MHAVQPEYRPVLQFLQQVSPCRGTNKFFFLNKKCFKLEKFFQTSQKKIFQHTTVAIFSTPNFSAWVVHRYMKTMQNVWPIVLASL
jgi:hypothetical protein